MPTDSANTSQAIVLSPAWLFVLETGMRKATFQTSLINRSLGIIPSIVPLSSLMDLSKSSSVPTGTG